MRIVVSGTHASGKSSLIGAFASAHPEFSVLADPFELIDDAPDEPDAATYAAQLRIAAYRLADLDPGEKVIAERGPIDFLAYLTALEDLGRTAGQSLAGATTLTARALELVDLLVVLPLSPGDGIRVPEDEDPELREAMNDALRDLVDELDIVGRTRVVEIAGSPRTRLAQLEAAVGEDR